MFEARLEEAETFKKLIESIKDLVVEVNMETTPNGITLQAMDTAHVALIGMNLKQEGFADYRSDKPITLGNNPL